MNIIKDKIGVTDTLKLDETIYKQNPTFRTQVTVGKRPYLKNGMTYLEEVLDDGANQTVLGGALWLLMKISNLTPPITAPTLNSVYNVATEVLQDENIKENAICLFGLGTGGVDGASFEVNGVNYKQTQLSELIPFRVTTGELSTDDKEKYFMKAVNGTTKSFYLKRPESSIIKGLWKNNGTQDGTAITSAAFDSTDTTPIEPFIEYLLRITTTDFDEYFASLTPAEQARVNTIGLFVGTKVQLADSSYEYVNVKLFSAYNFQNRFLDLTEDLYIRYRIYAN